MSTRPKTKIVLTLIGAIILLSIIDVFSNFLSAVPLIGPILESIQESVNEVLQVTLTAILGMVAIKR